MSVRAELFRKLRITNAKAMPVVRNTMVSEIEISLRDIDDFLSRYEKKYRKRIIAESTYKNVVLVLGNFLAFLERKFGSYEKYTIDTELLDEFFTSLASGFVNKEGRVVKYKTKTIEKFVAYIGALIKFVASRRGIVFDYEFTMKSIFGGKGIKVDAEDYESTISRMTTPAQVQLELDRIHKMYEAGRIRERTKDKLITLVLLGSYTGARGTEIQRVKVKNVLFDKGVIEFYRDKLYKDKVTLFPLHPLLDSWLQYYIGKYNLKPNDKLLSIKRVDRYFAHYNVKLKLRSMRAMNAMFLSNSRFLEYLMGHVKNQFISNITVNHYLSKDVENISSAFVAPGVPNKVVEKLKELKKTATQELLGYHDIVTAIRLDYLAHYPVIVYNVYEEVVWDIFEKITQFHHLNLPVQPI